MAEIRVINPIKSVEDKKLRVCAYARVSSNSADQSNSFITQVKYYTDLIKKNHDWEFVDIYADEGLTGLRTDKREEFLRMLNDCRKGKIDKIFTKSISRFSRNTKDCLETIRELKALNIEIEFEKEQINTGKITSEMIVTIHSSMAQEESISISNNMRWSYQKRMQSGKFITCKAPFGYRLIDNELVIDEYESGIVRRIYDGYLNGKGKQELADEMTREGVPKREGCQKWNYSTVAYILTNERYIGNALLQKKHTTDTLPFKKMRNFGEKDRYYISESNEPIISKEIFEQVKQISDNKHFRFSGDEPKNYALSKKIKCSKCGSTFKRTTSKEKVFWVCRNHFKNKDLCDTKQISEQQLYVAFIKIYNILKANSRTLLSTLLQQLTELKTKSYTNGDKILEIDKQVADLSEQNLVLNRLRSKGYMDSALFTSQSNELIKKISILRSQRRKLLNLNDDDKTIDNTKLIIDILENGAPFIAKFDVTLFNDLVERITVNSQDEASFYLINGLELKEKIERG